MGKNRHDSESPEIVGKRGIFLYEMSVHVDKLGGEKTLYMYIVEVDDNDTKLHKVNSTERSRTMSEKLFKGKDLGSNTGEYFYEGELDIQERHKLDSSTGVYALEA